MKRRVAGAGPSGAHPTTRHPAPAGSSASRVAPCATATSLVTRFRDNKTKSAPRDEEGSITRGG